jgi:hypothetical protein
MNNNRLYRLAENFYLKLIKAEENASTEIEDFIYHFHRKLLSTISSLGGDILYLTEIRNNMDKSEQTYPIIKGVRNLVRDLYNDLRLINRNASEKEPYGGSIKFVQFMLSESTLTKINTINYYNNKIIKNRSLLQTINDLNKLTKESEMFISENNDPGRENTIPDQSLPRVHNPNSNVDTVNQLKKKH